jgi:septal ring factor EnvC (AmiA/AmiB activator)
VTYIEHRVVKDETLYGIARKYGDAVGVLLEANNISLDHVLWVGERIRVPQQADSAGTSKLTVAPAPVPAADPRATTAKPVDTSLRWPVTAKEIAYMTGKLSGVMVTGERAESVKSLTQGTVVSAGPYRGFGRVAIIQATGGYLYVYGGCESLSVKEGDRVAPGTELGKLGIDAVTEKPQLFFLVYRNNAPVDPSKAPRA